MPPDRGRRGGLTLAEFAPQFRAYLRAAGRSPKRIAAQMRVIREVLRPAIGETPIDEMVPHLQRIKASVGHRTSRGSDMVFTVLKEMFSAAAELGVTAPPPSEVERFMIRNHLREPLTEQETENLVRAARELDDRILTFVLLGVDAGLCGSEMLALTPADVDIPERLLLVRAQAVSRSDGVGCVAQPYSGHAAFSPGRTRVVPMTERLVRAVGTLQPTGALLKCDQGKRATQNTLRPWLARCQLRAGLRRRVGLLELQNCFRNRLARLATPPHVLRALTGYSPRYWPFVGEVTLEEKRTAVALLQRRIESGGDPREPDAFGG